MNSGRLLASAALIALAGAGAGHAQSQEEAAVKARQAHMTLFAQNIGVLGGMARGNMDYDAETASAAAGNLAALAGMSQRFYWLPGTSNENMEGTRALPAIWAEGSDISAKAAAVSEAADDLAAVAGDGLDALRAGLGPVGQACGACHEDYRQSDD